MFSTRSCWDEAFRIKISPPHGYVYMDRQKYLLEVMEPNEPSATMGRNQLDGRANSCPPMGRDMTRDKGTAVAVVDERISTSHSHAGVAMLHAVGMSNSDPPKNRPAMKNPAATPVLMLRKENGGNGEDFYRLLP